MFAINFDKLFVLTITFRMNQFDCNSIVNHLVKLLTAQFEISLEMPNKIYEKKKMFVHILSQGDIYYLNEFVCLCVCDCRTRKSIPLSLIRRLICNVHGLRVWILTRNGLTMIDFSVRSQQWFDVIEINMKRYTANCNFCR